MTRPITSTSAVADVTALATLDLDGLRAVWRRRWGTPPPLRSVELLRLQLAFERIRPAVIRTAHLRRVAVRLSHHRRRVMTAHIEEGPDLIVAAANNHDRFVANISRHVVTRFLKLIDAGRYLPRLAEDGSLFEFEDAFVCVPRRGNG